MLQPRTIGTYGDTSKKEKMMNSNMDVLLIKYQSFLTKHDKIKTALEKLEKDYAKLEIIDNNKVLTKEVYLQADEIKIAIKEILATEDNNDAYDILLALAEKFPRNEDNQDPITYEQIEDEYRFVDAVTSYHYDVRNILKYHEKRTNRKDEFYGKLYTINPLTDLPFGCREVERIKQLNDEKKILPSYQNEIPYARSILSTTLSPLSNLSLEIGWEFNHYFSNRSNFRNDERENSFYNTLSPDDSLSLDWYTHRLDTNNNNYITNHPIYQVTSEIEIHDCVIVRHDFDGTLIYSTSHHTQDSNNHTIHIKKILELYPNHLEYMTQLDTDTIKKVCAETAISKPDISISVLLNSELRDRLGDFAHAQIFGRNKDIILSLHASQGIEFFSHFYCSGLDTICSKTIHERPNITVAIFSNKILRDRILGTYQKMIIEKSYEVAFTLYQNNKLYLSEFDSLCLIGICLATATQNPEISVDILSGIELSFWTSCCKEIFEKNPKISEMLKKHRNKVEKSFTEMRKNARIIAQDMRNGGLFSTLPMDLNAIIVGFTGDNNVHDTEQATKIATDHFCKP